MRKFALVILDLQDQVKDRYNLDLVTAPTGLGFTLNMSKLTGDIEDTITNVAQAKNVIKFTVNQYEDSYMKANSLSLWVQKYSSAENIMALEYDDGQIVRYCEGRVTSLGKTELANFRNLPQELKFTQTTPFFVKRENTITIVKSSVGKSYPYKYPYSYGRSVVMNNEIINDYIFDVPLIITIEGAFDNPRIDLLDENGDSYNAVAFDEALYSRETIVINSAQKKIYKITNGKTVDYRPHVTPDGDTFLMAKNGKSTISVIIDNVNEDFKLTGGWREYRL